MSERDVVARTPAPRTREDLVSGLRRLGIGAGDTVLVHCSLSAIGWVPGGATAVIQALRDVLTDMGTLGHARALGAAERSCRVEGASNPGRVA